MDCLACTHCGRRFSNVPPDEAWGWRAAGDADTVPCVLSALVSPGCLWKSAPLLCVRGRADVLLRAADVAFNLRGGTRRLAFPGHAAVALQRSRFHRAVRLVGGQVAHVEQAFPNIRSYLTLAAVEVEITFSWIILFTFMLSLRDVHGCGGTLLLLKPEQSENVYIFISHPSRACHPTNCNSFCL